MKYYIAYGSNLKTQDFYKRCPNAKLVTTGFLDGYELSFKKTKTSNVYLTIEEKEESDLPIAIYKITETDEVAIDDYESLHTGLYYKTETPYLLHNEKSQTIIYFMNDNSTYELPSDRYYQTVKEGYLEHGFDIKYLEKALQKSKEWNDKI